MSRVGTLGRDVPSILERADTKTLIGPGMQARVDTFGNVLVEMA